MCLLLDVVGREIAQSLASLSTKRAIRVHTRLDPLVLEGWNSGPFTDRQRYINTFLRQKWQLEWDTAVDNKLHSIQPTLGHWRGACRPVRREEAVLARVRIGHSYITHSYLLKKEDQPQCVACNSPLTVKHIA